MTLKTQTLFIFSFASLAPVASLALNPFWFWLGSEAALSRLRLTQFGHGPEVLGIGRIFPGRAPLAAAHLEGNPGIGFDPAGTSPAGCGRAILGDLRF